MRNINTPETNQNRWSDEKVELIIGTLLRVGVLISATVVALGAIPYLLAHGSTPVHFGAFHGQPESVTSVREILRGAAALHSPSIIQLGILLLIATPIARVVLSLIAFAKQRDRTYVIITTVVLTILLWSLSGGSSL
jgi:uncharacterized membrane protein